MSTTIKTETFEHGGVNYTVKWYSENDAPFSLTLEPPAGTAPMTKRATEAVARAFRRKYKTIAERAARSFQLTYTKKRK